MKEEKKPEVVPVERVSVNLELLNRAMGVLQSLPFSQVADVLLGLKEDAKVIK